MNRLSRAGAFALAIAAGSACAHGDEPHGDAPHPAPAASAAGPRFEAATNLFEVVGSLHDGVLTLWLGRYASGEPVADARVEIEQGTLATTARYRPAAGDYVVADAAFVAALARPGPHALVLAVTAGDDADLLDATLSAAPPPAPLAPPPAPGRLVAVALLALAAVAALGLLWRRQRTRGVAA